MSTYTIYLNVSVSTNESFVRDYAEGIARRQPIIDGVINTAELIISAIYINNRMEKKSLLF